MEKGSLSDIGFKILFEDFLQEHAYTLNIHDKDINKGKILVSLND